MWLLSCVFLDFEGDYIVSTRFDYEQFERFYNESLKDTYIDAANKISAIARKRIAFRSVVEQKMKAVKLEKQRQDAIDRAKEILRVQQENEALKGILPAPNSTPRSHVKQKVSINTAPTGGSNNSKKNTIADQITNRVPGEIKITADDILAKEDLSIDSQFRRPGAGGEKFDAVRPERRRSVAMPSLRQRSVIEKEISEIRSEMDEAMSRVLEELTQVKAKLEIAQSEQFYGRRKFEFSSSSKPSSPTTLLRKSFNPGELTLDSAVLVHQDTLKQQQEEHTKEVDDLKATLVGLLSKIDQLEGEINQHKKDSYDIGKQMKSKLAATKIEVESSNSQLAERVRQDTLAELEERINKVRDEIIQTEEEKMQQFIQRENELKAQAILDQHESMEKLKNDLLEQQRELTLLKSQKPSSSLQKRGRPKSADKCNTTLVDSPEDISSPEHAHSRMAPKERPAKHPSKALQQSDSCGLEGSRTIENALSSHLLHTADLPNNVRSAQSASKLPTESNVSLTHGKVTMKATRWNFFRRLITYFFKPRKLPPAIKAAPSIDSTSIRRKFSEVSELSTGTIQHANSINRTNTILTNQNKESTNAYSSFMPDGSFLMGAAGIFNILDSINSVEELTPSEQAELEREKEDLSAMIVQKAIRNFIGINRLKYNSEKYLKLIILTTTPWIVDESLKTSIVEDSYELAIATLKRLYSLLSKSKFGKGKFPVNSNLLLNTIAFFYSRDVELVEKGLDCINLIIKENKSVFDSNILPLSDLIQHALLSYNRNMSFVIKLGRVIFKLSESQLTNRERFSSNELCQLYKCVLEEYSTQPKVIEIIIKCLVKITMDSADSRTRIGENGLCDAVLDCFADYIDNEKLFILCCKAITNFCGDDHTHNQLRFCESIYPNVYLRSILAVKFKPQSMEALLTAIASIVSNNELARNSLEEAGLCEVLIDLITINFVGENCNDEILINSLWALGYLSNASKGKSYNTRHARILQLLKRFDSDIIDESIRAQALLTFQKIFDGEYDSSMFTDGKLIVHNSSKDDKNRTAKNLIAPESTPLRPPTASFKKTRVEHEDDFSVLSPGESVFVSTFDNSELKEGSFASGALEEASHFDAAENIESLPVEVVETSLEQEASKVQE